MSLIFKLMATAAITLAASFNTVAFAKYPDKPIRFVVSFPPGSGTDTNARYTARRLQEKLGVPVTVENRPGGNSFMAVDQVVRAKPDGYTLLFSSNSPVSTNVVMFKDLPYDPVKDLTPLAKLGYGAMGIAVPASSPIQNIEQLVEEAKKRPGELNYGSGSASYQIATELFLKQAGIEANHVPYRGASAAITDLAGKQTDFVFADYGALIPLAQSNSIRVIAATGDKRLKQAPDVPTLQESGYKDYYMVNWVALFGPAGLPEDVQKVLSDAMVEIYSDQESIDFLDRMSWDIFPGDGKALAEFQQSEIKRWSDAAKQANIPQQ